MPVRNYRDLIAWQKAMDLVICIYAATQTFPRDELFGLTSQMRRAAVSIPCNIAEGQSRDSTREFVHFLSIACGSLSELETQLMIADRLHYLSSQQTASQLEACSELARIIHGLKRSLPLS